MSNRPHMALDMPPGTSLLPDEHLISRTDLPAQVVWLTNERLLWVHKGDGQSSVRTVAVHEIARVYWGQATNGRRILGGLLVVVLSTVAFGVSAVLGVIGLAVATYVLRSAARRELRARQASGKVVFSARFDKQSADALDQLRRALSDLLAHRSNQSTPAT